jgi:hypothetical protein
MVVFWIVIVLFPSTDGYVAIIFSEQDRLASLFGIYEQKF